MERLTKKEESGLYYPTEKGQFYTSPDDGSNACRLLQIIGQYEDLREESNMTVKEAYDKAKAYDVLKRKMEFYESNNKYQIELIFPNLTQEQYEILKKAGVE